MAAEIEAGRAPKGVLANADGVWVADVHGGAVLRIDPATNDVAATIKVGSATPGGPNWLAEGLGSIWVDVPNNQTIARIDPVTDAIQATIDATDWFQPCGGIAMTTTRRGSRVAASGGVLMARVDAHVEHRPSPRSTMHGNGYNPAVINGFVWVSVDGGTPESREAGSDRPDHELRSIACSCPSPTFGGGGDIVVAAGSVWVVDGYHNTFVGLPYVGVRALGNRLAS